MSIDNMESKNIIDVDYDEVENVLYLSAPQLARKIGTTEATIRTWAEVYGDLIGIEKINGRKTYKETQVPYFTFIKELVDNKNMKKTQVRNYISKHGFKYAEYNSGLVDTKDPLGFEALASALSIEVSNKLNIFSKELISNVSNQLSEHLMIQQQMNIENRAEIESSVDEIMESKVNVILEKQQNKLDSALQDFKSYIDTKEQETKVRDTEMLDMLKHRMESTKLLQDIESQKKKSIWSRITGK